MSCEERVVPAFATGDGQAPDCIYRFGLFEADFKAGELRRDGARVKIQDQPLQVLLRLLQHPNELVTREELRQQLWPDGTFVNFDHGLNNTLKRLRQALRDHPTNPRFIETLPRHGYRFIAPVSIVEHPSTHVSSCGNSSNEEGVSYDASNSGPISRRRGRTGYAAASMIMVLGFFVAIYGLPIKGGYRSSPQRLVIAVAPFQSLGFDRSDDVLAKGMTQEVITQLGKVQGAQVTVVSGAAIGSNSFKEDLVSGLGRDSQVDYALEGSTRIEGQHVRIAVQLLRVRDRAYVWTESYDGELKDALTLEVQVAQQTRNTLLKTLAK